MRFYLLHIFLCFVLLFQSQQASASRIDKGYEALGQFDYFKAKKYFTKGLKYNQTSASQGLAIVFYRNDNPFHNYDSALFYVQQSILGWDMEKAKKKERYAIYGFSSDSLLNFRALISTKIFQQFEQAKDIDQLTHFINVHTWAKENSRAIAIRDSLAFFDAVGINTAASYKYFIDTYPTSVYYDLALSNYFDAQFMEMTEDGSLDSYITFVKDHPESPLFVDAERKIYTIVTQQKNRESYLDFIQRFNANSFIDSAWVGLFQIFVSNYTKESFDEFLMMYPDTPIKDNILKEYSLMDSVFLPFIEEGKFGYMDMEGKMVIDPHYDYVGFFDEGLAIVSYKDRFGFVDKLNQLRIPYSFDQVTEFNQGHAIVELNDKYGVIDRNGNYVFDCIYDDIGTLSEGLIHASLNEKYGYYNAKGEMVIPHNFDDAFEFKNHQAKVEVGGNHAYIDTNGVYIIEPCFESIAPFFDTLFVFTTEGMYGLMNANCQIIVQPEYDYIGSIKNGLALSVIDDRIVYLDTLGRWIIDNEYEVFANYIEKAEFENNIAIVSKKGKFGRINTKNKEVTPVNFESIGRGTQFFPAQLKGYWGLFDKSNKEVVKPIFDAIELIDDQYIITFKNDTVSVMNVNGQVVIPPMFDGVEYLGQKLFLVQQNGKYGVYQETKLVVPVIYDQIGEYDEDLLFLIRAGLLEYFFIPKQEVIGRIKEE